MTIYAVGDIQGCVEPLQQLLEKISFDPSRDQLWSTGDIVNRGPKSLQTLRFLKNLGPSFRMVLGNHDLHLLATAKGHRKPTPKDTLDEIYNAPDVDELTAWLQHQPVLIHDHGYVMIHAGIPPQWSLAIAKQRANEVEQVLRSDDSEKLFMHMYGNTPDHWQSQLPEVERLRVITNYFTRMRYCDAEGKLELNCKLAPEHGPAGFKPWYSHPQRETAEEKLIFGHWAALEGRYCGDRLFPLDTGCVWGKCLRILNLNDKSYVHCDCSDQNQQKPGG